MPFRCEICVVGFRYIYGGVGHCAPHGHCAVGRVFGVIGHCLSVIVIVAGGIPFICQGQCRLDTYQDKVGNSSICHGEHRKAANYSFTVKAQNDS